MLSGSKEMETKHLLTKQRRPPLSAQIVENVTSHNLALPSIQKLNIRIRSTNARSVTSRSHDQQMLPGT